MRSRWWVALAGVLSFGALTACGDSDETPVDPERVVLAPAEPGSDHTHGTGDQTQTIGDGTTPTAGGWSMTDLRLPQRAGEPGDLRFRVVDAAGDPLLAYTEEQTKLLHLYVVRNDLQDYRHLHPTMAADGTWTARVNLRGPGPYRAIAEFAPATSAEGRRVVLGRSDIVPGRWAPEAIPSDATGDDGIVRVEAPETVSSGPDGRMTLRLTDVASGGALRLGSFLGTFSHLTGFHAETGTFTHVHPYGEPVMGDDSTDLTFHTEFSEPGRYVFFVQVRVDEFVHTVPVVTTVA